MCKSQKPRLFWRAVSVKLSNLPGTAALFRNEFHLSRVLSLFCSWAPTDESDVPGLCLQAKLKNCSILLSAGTYSDYCSLKRLAVLQLPWDCILA